MEKTLLTISFFIFVVSSYSQDLGDFGYDLNFEDTSVIHHVTIDSITNPNNIWQIGSPNKLFFTSSLSTPFAILTDTINTYPINDTSVFNIINKVNGEGWPLGQEVILSGYYQVNSDSLTDFGKIEVSPNNGITWIDLINDTLYSTKYEWITPKPVLSGNSNGWQYFYVWLGRLGPLFNVQYDDTVLFRFTFISDNVQTNKDGLMFDDFHFEDYAEGIQKVYDENLISIFPNPANSELIFFRKSNSRIQSIQIFDLLGQIVLEKSNFIGQTIDINQLRDGVYFLKYSDSQNYNIKKFIIQH